MRHHAQHTTLTALEWIKWLTPSLVWTPNWSVPVHLTLHIQQLLCELGSGNHVPAQKGDRFVLFLATLRFIKGDLDAIPVVEID